MKLDAHEIYEIEKKLTTAQIETIERYILSWDIVNKEFFYEILDHFISATESRMSDTNEDFHIAFPEVSYLFADDFYQKGEIGMKYYGIKAMEMRFLEKSRKRGLKNILRFTWTLLKSPLGFIWILIALCCFQLYQIGIIKPLMFVLFFANTFIPFWPIIKKWTLKGSFETFKTIFRFEEKLELPQLKRKKLIYQPEYYLIWLVNFQLVYIPQYYRMFFSSSEALPEWGKPYVILVGLLLLPFSLGVNKYIRSKKLDFNLES